MVESSPAIGEAVVTNGQSAPDAGDVGIALAVTDAGATNAPATAPPYGWPAVPAPRPGRRSGLFGLRKGSEETARLREWIARTHGLEALQVIDAVQEARAEAAELVQQAKEETERLRAEAQAEARQLRKELGNAAKKEHEEARAAAKEAERARKDIEKQNRELVDVQTKVARLQAQVVVTDETLMLQEVGIYAYHHPLQDAVAYRTALTTLQREIKELARCGQAVLSATDWTVNGSKREGMKMVRDFSKLMLRAYNAEADNAVRTMRAHRLSPLVDRLYKSRDTIAKLGATMRIRISDQYHDARVRELYLTADYLQKKDEEKERQREARAREREEAAAQRDFERKREKLEKELNHYQAALQRLRERGDTAGAAELEKRLAEIETALRDVEARAANVRTGYVYVISNVGAFGDRIVKIGMTRRLEPMERIYELSGASVPFRFDVHALIFSEDAVGLETQLHQTFADRRVNQVNTRREFFYVTPAEVRNALERFAGQHLVEFTEVPPALEWRASTRTTDSR